MNDAEVIPVETKPISIATRRKTSFAGDVMKLVSGTTFAQVVGVLASPLLTRLYAPEAFGASALFKATKRLPICWASVWGLC